MADEEMPEEAITPEELALAGTEEAEPRLGDTGRQLNLENRDGSPLELSKNGWLGLSRTPKNAITALLVQIGIPIAQARAFAAQTNDSMTLEQIVKRATDEFSQSFAAEGAGQVVGEVLGIYLSGGERDRQAFKAWTDGNFEGMVALATDTVVGSIGEGGFRDLRQDKAITEELLGKGDPWWSRVGSAIGDEINVHRDGAFSFGREEEQGAGFGDFLDNTKDLLSQGPDVLDTLMTNEEKTYNFADGSSLIGTPEVRKWLGQDPVIMERVQEALSSVLPPEMIGSSQYAELLNQATKIGSFGALEGEEQQRVRRINEISTSFMDKTGQSFTNKKVYADLVALNMDVERLRGIGVSSGDSPHLFAPETRDRLGSHGITQEQIKESGGFDVFQGDPNLTQRNQVVSMAEVYRWWTRDASAEEREEIQRDLWEAGFYSEGDILSGETPIWGFSDNKTKDAVDRFFTELITGVQQGETIDLTAFLAERKRSSELLHKQAFDTQNSMDGLSGSPRTFTQLTDDNVEALIDDSVRSILGRDAPPDVVRAVRNSVNANKRRYAEALSKQDELDAIMGRTQSNIVDARGYAINGSTRLVRGVDPNQSPSTYLDHNLGTVNDQNSDDPATVAAVLRGIKATESKGRYTAQNSSSSASGAYQFTDGTWAAAGGTRFAPRAYMATPEEQDAVAEGWLRGKYREYGNWDQAISAWIQPGMTRAGQRNQPIHDGKGNVVHDITLNEYTRDVKDNAFGAYAGLADPAYADPFQLPDMTSLGINPNPAGGFQDNQGNDIPTNSPVAIQNGYGANLLDGQISQDAVARSGYRTVEVPYSMNSEDMKFEAEKLLLENYEPEVKRKRAINYFNELSGLSKIQGL